MNHVLRVLAAVSIAVAAPAATAFLRSTTVSHQPSQGLCKQTLAADDVEAACAIYPSGQPTLTCLSTPQQSTAHCRTTV